MNKKQQAVAYRAECLRFIAKAGYASLRQVARALFGEVTASKRVMSSRTVNWLEKRGLLVSKRVIDTPLGEKLVALSVKGARQLTEETGIETMDGRHLLRRAHPHRTAANWIVAAAWHNDKYTQVWSDYEIQKGTAPVRGNYYRTAENTGTGKKETKLADALLQNTAGNLVWVEIENSWRNLKDLTKLCEFIQYKFDTDNDDETVEQILIIVTAKIAKGIKKRLYKARVGKWWHQLLDQHVWFGELDWETGKFTAL